ALRALASDVAPGDVEAAIASLDRSGLVQPEDEPAGRWRFAHALVLEAAYRRLSKGQRAELQEQLGVRDERSAVLALRAGELFAAAGLRAFAAVDLITSRDLLSRAAVLLPVSDPRRLDMLPNLGVALT